MSKITFVLGQGTEETEVSFNVETSDYNDYLNNTMPNDKVGPAYNFLINTVCDESKTAFKEKVLIDGVPNGMAVVDIAGQIIEQVSGSLSVKVKKPSKSPSK